MPRYVLGDDSVSHHSERKRKFESISKLSSCPVFDTMLLMFKCPPSNPLGFVHMSHKTLAWFTGWENLNILLTAVILRRSPQAQSPGLKIAFCEVALEITNWLSLPWCSSILLTSTGVSDSVFWPQIRMNRSHQVASRPVIWTGRIRCRYRPAKVGILAFPLFGTAEDD